MLPYWLFFIVPTIAAIYAWPTIGFHRNGMRALTRCSPIWFLMMIGLTLIIGFRYEVGGDWGNYFRYLNNARFLNFSDLIELHDPAYWALNILSVWLGWEMTGVNVIAGLIFSVGLITFCLNLPRPWLALSCAMPYLVTVVAMGYTRQAIAIGFVMISFVALQRNLYIRFAVFILIASLFHRTAIVLMPIAALVVNSNRIQAVGIIGFLALIGYEFVLSDHIEHLTNLYHDANVQSSGALVRLTMNVVPAVLMLVFHRHFAFSLSEKRLWIIVSIISICMFLVFFITNLSTALDRMALYFIPLQLVIFSHLPNVGGHPNRRIEIIVIGIILYNAAVLFFWLNFAYHSYAWIPYSMGLS